MAEWGPEPPRRRRRRASEPAHGGRRPLRDRAPARGRRDVDGLHGEGHRARAAGGGEAAGRAPRGRRGLRVPLPARGAVRREAPAPEHRAGVRLRPGPRERAPLHRHGVRGRAVGGRHAARAQAARHRRDGAARAGRLPRARLCAPRRRGAPRREARQPAVRRGDGRHQARGLRHRQGGRADAHHPGGLGARHGRLPVTRAGPRRGGRPSVGHLLARRVRVPVPDRPAAARVHVAHRAGAQAAVRIPWRR